MDKLEKDFDTFDKNGMWLHIFQYIQKESLKVEHAAEEAKKPENKVLNRYEDVYPYDENRIILLRQGYNYINASTVFVPGIFKKYILTQGPLSNTIEHFWLMIWEQKSRIIIMLNKLIEKNQVKCVQYWPNLYDEVLELPNIDLKIELLSEKDLSHYTARYFRLTHTKCKEERDVIQYHYTTWPDFGVPQSSNEFLRFLRDIRQDYFYNDESLPVVHCSAGIGRSGTFCLVEFCLLLMEQNGTKNVNIINTLLQIRSCRMGLVQTYDQLRFCYISIIQGLKVDWNAKHDFGLPNDGLAVHHLNKNVKDFIQDDAPPLPPPRNCSLQAGKPLPQLPHEFSTDSADSENECKADNESTTEIEKHKQHLKMNEKSKALSNKIKEMKKKQLEAEDWIRRKTMLINISTGLSVVALSGVIIAYFWFGK